MSDDLATRQEGDEIVVYNPDTGEEWFKSDRLDDLDANR